MKMPRQQMLWDMPVYNFLGERCQDSWENLETKNCDSSNPPSTRHKKASKQYCQSKFSELESGRCISAFPSKAHPANQVVA
jgi:hypothetical protein